MNQLIQDYFKKQLSPFGLNFKEFTVLELVYQEGRQPIQKLGKCGMSTSSNITYVVDKLEKKGLINRKPCVNDRRVIYACITDEGRDLIEKLLPRYQQTLQSCFAACSDDEIRTGLSLLDKMEKQINHVQ